MDLSLLGFVHIIPRLIFPVKIAFADKACDIFAAMKFYGEEHRALILRLESSWENLNELRKLAEEFGITDIFQDNGAKTLQQLIYLNIRIIPLTLILSAREKLKLTVRNFYIFPAHYSVIIIFCCLY